MAPGKGKNNNEDYKGLPNPFNLYKALYEEPAIILLEKVVIQLLGSVKDKPHWTNKVQDGQLRGKYEQEMLEQLEERFKREREEAEKLAETGRDSEPNNMYQVPAHLKIKPKDIVDYVMRELVLWSEKRYDDSGVSAGPVDGVYVADHDLGHTNGLLSDDIRTTFQAQIRKFHNEIPHADKDYHPGSDGRILDLVHPSLYCLVDGVSMVYKTPLVDVKKKAKLDVAASMDICASSSPKEAANQLKIAKIKLSKEEDQSEMASKTFQWLPSEVSVSIDGKVSIDSYINNLHPVNESALYASIESIFTAFIPMFNAVLRDLKGKAVAEEREDKIRRIQFNDWNDPEPDFDDDDDDGDGDDAYENYMNTRIVHIPPLPAQTWGKDEKGSGGVGKALRLNGRQVQVIVKLANIDLTPEKPRYEGGVWHIEGMSNENIVATGIYYYDIDNITHSALRFRAAIDEMGVDYEQSDNPGVKAIYGLQDEDALNQDRGFVTAIAGRMIAFPNIYQHRVEPFELRDKSKPGHRNILVFFLIDPSRRILSTADVPPQQAHWWMKYSAADTKQKWPMSKQQAEKYRDELMKERKFFIDSNNKDFFERPFSLCEH